MATTEQKKPQAKPRAKNPAGKKPVAKASRPEVRKTAPAKDPAPVKAPTPAQVAEAPVVLVNAVKPEEKLPETALVTQAMDSLEKSLKAAVPAAVAVNSKLRGHRPSEHQCRHGARARSRRRQDADGVHAARHDLLAGDHGRVPGAGAGAAHAASGVRGDGERAALHVDDE